MERFPMPNILQCYRFIAKGQRIGRRIVRDYEFDFYMDGERDVYIDGQYHKISKGTLIFRKPGQNIIGTGDYDMFLLTLDFTKQSKIPEGKYFRNSATPQQRDCELDLLDDIPVVFTPYHQDEIIELYEIMCKYSYPNNQDNAIRQKALLELLFLILADAYKYNRKTSEQKEKSKSYVKLACDYINHNYSADISVNSVANHLSLNKNYFIKLFKNSLGQTPNQYIMDTRLFYAKSMLIQSEVSIKEIGFSCGFNTISYFIKCFKRKFGESPYVYRKKYMAAKNGN